MLKGNCPTKVGLFVVFLLDVMLNSILPFLFLDFSSILIYSTGIFLCHFTFRLEQMLRCLCLVTSLKLLQKVLRISFIDSYSCWLGGCFYLNYLASVSLPNKKKNPSVIF